MLGFFKKLFGWPHKKQEDPDNRKPAGEEPPETTRSAPPAPEVKQSRTATRAHKPAKPLAQQLDLDIQARQKEPAPPVTKDRASDDDAITEQSAVPKIVNEREEPQPPGKPARQQLVMGFDFGTAFTKVVIGETRTHFAVPFAEFTGGTNPYLLQSRYYAADDGTCALGGGEGREITDLKMRILDNHCSASDEVELTAFMALVMRYARNWLLAEHADLYSDKTIDWLINVGLPTGSYDIDELSQLYRHMTRAAWATSNTKGPITLAMVEDWLVRLQIEDDSAAQETIDDEAIGLFPEFVAQITGYVRSPLRQEDLHMLVDVGAGTVDISIFNVMEKDGEDQFPVMARSVEKLGTAYLMRRRLESVGKKMRSLAAFHSVPSREALAKQFGVDVEQIERHDESFRTRLIERIFDKLRYTKQKRYIRSQKWRTGVTTFFCGGGARVDLYKEIAAHFAARGGDIRIAHMPLEIPDDIEAPLATPDNYDRLSVAYGLSFDPFDIGEIIRASEIEDDEPDPTSPEPAHTNWYKS